MKFFVHERESEQRGRDNELQSSKERRKTSGARVTKILISKKYQFTLNEGELIKLYQSPSVGYFTEVIQKHLSPSTEYTRKRPFTLVFIHQVNYARKQNGHEYSWVYSALPLHN